MKKLLLALVFTAILTGCSLLTQVEQASPNAEIERLLLPDSSSIYFINWNGHIYIYNP
jgi:outer membrane biogenesis lipoprotein LolB